MKSLLLSFWDTISHGVSLWSVTTYSLVMSILGVCVLLGLLSFFKKNFDKGKPIKWGTIIMICLLALVMIVLALARFT